MARVEATSVQQGKGATVGVVEEEVQHRAVPLYPIKVKLVKIISCQQICRLVTVSTVAREKTSMECLLAHI
ncbi:hypothetical protein TYRP_015295 [Tyrophagus putrescentiae]|nr:hypothetical protein TYRP_015295 [Tyrophagus putrescentiae]